MPVIQVRHPLLEHSLGMLRDARTTAAAFRQHAALVSRILLVEATQRLSLTDREIHTPLAAMTARQLADDVVFVPVLRAGLAMLLAGQDFFPGAGVGFIGLERDEQTAQARGYYQKLPPLLPSHQVFVLDPMLATGGSIAATIEALQSAGAKRFTLVCIVAAPEGIAHIERRFPQVEIITAAVDSHLNEHKFIVPGLGDFGDRYFGT